MSSGPKIDEDRKAAVLKLYSEGKSLRQIAEAIGYQNKASVHYALQRYGAVKPKPQPLSEAEHSRMFRLDAARGSRMLHEATVRYFKKHHWSAAEIALYDACRSEEGR